MLLGLRGGRPVATSKNLLCRGYFHAYDRSMLRLQCFVHPALCCCLAGLMQVCACICVHDADNERLRTVGFVFTAAFAVE